MTDDPPRGPGGFPMSAEQVYFRAIEEVFLRLRGAPLTLGESDYALARSWQRAGVPLELVARVLEEVFARRHARGDEDKVWTLRQCRRAVVAAWQEQARLAAPARSVGEAPEIDLAARLGDLVSALPALVGSEDLRQRLEELAATAAGRDPAAVEEELIEIDAELLERAEAALDRRGRGELESELARAVTRLARQLPRDEVAAARTRLRRQLLRRRLDLPELSIFAEPG